MAPAPNDAEIRTPLRILTYSHDSFGLGHLRRSVTLATALVARGRSVHALCLTGSPVPDLFALPERCDLVKLPSIGKDREGGYVARRLPMSANEITSLRSDLITATVRSFRPDLLLVDGLLPKMDGFQMTRALRAIPEYRDTPILILSGLEEPEWPARAIEAGATGFILKSNNWDELVAHIGQYLP